MLNEFRAPRIEGSFAGEQMRAFDVVWGSARGDVVIENAYADVTGVVLTSGDSTIRADGRFSLGFPRRDEGEEINAILRLDRRPVADLRQGFGIEDYDVDGLFSGEFHVYGHYQTPQGFGSMAIADGVAYGESFEQATASVRLEGTGVRLDAIELLKGGGRATGAAYVGWNGTYSFNMDGRNIALEAVDAAKNAPLPLSGLIDFVAGGSGTFEMPSYDVRGTVRDLFAADEGIGQVVGTINIRGDLMTLRVEAASPRLAVSGAGRIALTPEMDAELTINVADTSLDPYVRAFEPRLSPFTTAVVSGTIRVVGELANMARLRVDATVDQFEASLFDYAIRNASPVRIALDRNSVRVSEMRLVGEGTQLDVSGLIDLEDERIAMRATGDANFSILQGFISNMRSAGRAVLAAALEGPLGEPLVSGTMTVNNGRIRHFSLPHALESINGVMRFDTRSIRLDELSAQLGGGPVTFGGSIGFDGYRPGRFDVTMSGTSMVVRFPEGMRSTVDAELTLQGTIEGATLSGEVTVREGEYTRAFDTGGSFLDLAESAPQLASTTIQTTVPLRYDVRVNAPSTIEVRNNNMQLLASADLQLRGTYDRPLLFGRAEIRDGEVLFEGKRYIVTRGTIDFNNPTRIEPFFDLEAETRVRVPGETYTVTLSFVGTFDRLAMQAESEPFLPEIEVLALLFSDIAPGQDVEFRQYSGVTPQERLVRDRATRALTGVISSPVGRVVEQTFGVDTFQITPSLINPNEQSSRLDPAARVTIGKRLSERVFLTYSRSLTSSTRDQIILLEYDQSDRFSWVLSRNEDRTYALDFRFRRTF
jgi:autotransporter translocation and assembly factor TamB